MRKRSDVKKFFFDFFKSLMYGRDLVKYINRTLIFLRIIEMS